MPDTFAEAPNGLVYDANGTDAMLRWDSLKPQMETAGVQPPATALTLAGSGAGGIYGAYTAYCRFVDQYGNFSNLSPVSGTLVTTGTTGAVTNATYASPIVITAPAHGLASGAVVSVSGVVGNTSANSTFSVTVIDANTFSLDNSVPSGAYVSGGTWVSGVAAVVYSGVPVSAEAKVTRRQILRNTNGQATTYYVDVDTTDLISTTLSGTNADPALAAQTAVPILDSSGNIFANRYTVPPSHKAVIAHHLDRMFAAAQEDYAEGSCKVTFGSTQVTGVATEWALPLAGRALYVVGAQNAYTILSVDQVNQVLTLTAPYADATDKFAVYAIRPQPAERRLVYYSEAGLPEAWPATNALEIQEDGDEIVGLMPKGSFLYILEKRHIWHFTGQTNPQTDGAVFLAANRGCVNNRCWVLVDDNAFMLDEMGIHSFNAGMDATTISDPIQDLFRPTSETLKYRINWRASKYFHAVHYLPQETIRWFVCLSGEYLPRHAICYQYRRKRWWLEEFQRPIGASCAGRVRGVPRVFLGTDAKGVQAFWEGFLDGPDPAKGTTRGTVTSALPCSFTDATATFAAAGLVNNPVAIVAGTGKGQVRIVSKVSGQTVTITQPWLVTPDATSVYQLGGIRWRLRTGWYRFVQDEEYNVRRVEALFQTTPHGATFDLRLHFDFSEAAAVFKTSMLSRDGNGVASAAGSADLVCDMGKASGFIQKQFNAGKEFNLDGKRYVQVELQAFTGIDPQSIFQLTIDGVAEPKGIGG